MSYPEWWVRKTYREPPGDYIRPFVGGSHLVRVVRDPLGATAVTPLGREVRYPAREVYNTEPHWLVYAVFPALALALMIALAVVVAVTS